ncbi:unnamed protein product [Cuscuta epithymum]|uniref:Uncharacterized protein n=1 Tax=Cuscuta epithymum TaxID=186058 RepID=A0AAV0D0S4_9ASTE|nr:unnamed protein product [Cuscuta epithymum]
MTPNYRFLGIHSTPGNQNRFSWIEIADEQPISYSLATEQIPNFNRLYSATNRNQIDFKNELDLNLTNETHIDATGGRLATPKTLMDPLAPNYLGASLKCRNGKKKLQIGDHIAVEESDILRIRGATSSPDPPSPGKIAGMTRDGRNCHNRNMNSPNRRQQTSAPEAPSTSAPIWCLLCFFLVSLFVCFFLSFVSRLVF